MPSINIVHISRVDLNLFVVFDAIYTEGGITAAARTLNLTQPAVSHALGRLRELFDDPLFERRGQGMVPTPLARTLVAEVRAALQGFERTLREGTRFDPATSERRFTLSMRDALEATLLPPLMAAIAREAPRIDVTTVRGDRRQLEAELLAGTIDAAVDILLPVSPAIRHAPLLSDPMVVLARPGHPVTQGPLTLERYLAYEHVHVSSRRRGAGLEDVELRRLGRERRVRLRCQHYLAACRVVSCTDLLVTLPVRYARIANAPYGNVMLPLPFKVPPLELYLYWHANSDQDAAGRWLRDHVFAAMAGVAEDEAAAALAGGNG
ncbi:LysR family transcriptional regulator [Ralstonia solanacearum]|uniref:LysR family transcriptional regulator n=1 Tax=Ralstonia solanacearum TaxID=305 RepID=A0AAD0S7J2_RALSL|nr:LysR family transcriptional regulator [Ralstonia solanacearum]AXV81219.1 LysR family transcriptional regulator [Ralstonia solanacearum]AXW52358.1 LysR family transcriptional regulator [Ralstonia solanacearum]